MKLFSIGSLGILGAVLIGASGCAHTTASKQTAKTSASRKKAASKEEASELKPLTEAELNQKVETLAHFATGVSNELNNKPEDAAEEYAKAAENDPTYEPLVLDIARKLIREQKTDQAIALLEKATALPTASGNLFAWLAIAYGTTGKIAPAIEANRTAIKKMPKNLGAYQNLGQLYLQNGQTNQALQVVKEASSQKDVDAEFLVGLAEVYSRFGRQQVIPEEESKAKMLEALDRAAATRPTNPIILQRLGDTYLQLGEAAKAEPFLTDLFDKYPELPGLRERVANLYLRLGAKDKATKLFEGLRRNRPTDPQPYFFLGTLAFESKEYDKAAEFYETAIKLNPDFEPLYYDLAGVELALKKPGEALATLEQARNRFKLNFTLEFYTGVCKAALEKYSEALLHLTSAELLAKMSEPAKLNHVFYFQLGSTYERSGNYKDAEKAFRKSLEISPKYAEALNYLGYMWAERGENLEEAKKMLDQAVELEPKNAAFLDSLAWVLYKSKRPAEALIWMLKALENSEKPDPTLYEHLGDIHADLKQFDKAKEAWSKSDQMQSNDNIKKKLQALPAE